MFDRLLKPSLARHVVRLGLVSLLLAAAPVPMALAATKSHTPVCGELASDTVWTADNVYEVNNCNIVVPVGVTLTIQAGTVVKFAGTAPGYASAPGSVTLVVAGTLNALGTAEAPVVLTSLADDAHGGDTNENGASSGSPGDWRGLILQPGSQTSLQHFVLAYAGSTVFTNGYGYGQAQIDANEVASLSLQDGEISDGHSKGLYLRGAGITPAVHNVAFNRNSSGTGLGDAIYQYAINMQPDYSGLSFSGNERNGVVIGQFGSSLTQDVTLAGVPYFTSCGYTLCILYVPSGFTLRIEAGASFDFAPVDGVTVQAGGSLIVEGTADAPVLFGSSAVVEGSTFSRWNGLFSQYGSTLRMQHCDISGSRNGNYGSGGLQISTADAQVRDCRIHHNLQAGLYIYADTANPLQGIVLENLTLSDNGEDGLWAGSTYRGGLVEFTLANTVSERNGRHGLFFTHGGDGPQMRPTLREVTVRDNAVDAVHFDLYDTYPVFDGVSILDNGGRAVYWPCDGSITASGITASGNGYDGIELPGCSVGGGHDWNLGNAGVPVDVTGNVYVTSGSFLSLQPGTTLRFAANKRLDLNNAILFALGDPGRPIVFQGANATPGGWVGIEAFGTLTSLYARNCEVRDANYGIVARYAFNQLMVQGCDLHHNNYGMEVQVEAQYPDPAIRNNAIRDNALYGVVSGYGSLVDARGNWWGDASGPYHATNPGGLGNAVGDNVLFDPWLLEPPAAVDSIGGVVVATGAPDFVSPGQLAEYSFQYLNLQSETVTGSVLVMQLPRAAEFVSASHGGEFWSERDQVVWRLGDLPAGGSGAVSARVRFAWGLPRDYRDGTVTLFAADNYPDPLISSADLLRYQGFDTDSRIAYTELAGTGEQFRAANPLLQAVYDQAIADGFRYHGAADVQFENSHQVRLALMVDPVRQSARELILRGGTEVFVFDFTPSEARFSGPDGGVFRLDLSSGAVTAEGAYADSFGVLKVPGCSYERCRNTCLGQLVGAKAITLGAAGYVSYLTVLSYMKAGAGIAGPAGIVLLVGKLGLDAWRCTLDCTANPQNYCCTAGQRKWTKSFVNRLTDTCGLWTCNATTQTWKYEGNDTCIIGQRCVASIDGKGCENCIEGKLLGVDALKLRTEVALAQPGDPCKAATGGKPRCKDLELLRAKDPNDIRGEDGDVLPGQLLNYTIRYENEGSGRAYGVYIVNELPPELDESTLVISDGGQYLAAERQIVWLVGELGPQGELDAEGQRSYSVQVRGGLASGTVIANSAVVYFPSVPEETPTNTWVNTVAPLAAIPQELQTDYEMPLPITLGGREISSLPLTYRIVDGPLRGELQGAGASLTYTPADTFVGADGFTFVVSNGVSESRPAQVRIVVSSAGDTLPPQVLTISPDDGAQDVRFSDLPDRQDETGDVYTPAILLGISETLDETTVNGDRVQLSSAGGTVLATASFDVLAQVIRVLPREPLQPDVEYTISVGSGITDLAGNALASASWTFRSAKHRVFQDGFEGND